MCEYLMDKFYEIKSSEDVANLEALIEAGVSEETLLEYLQNNI